MQNTYMSCTKIEEQTIENMCCRGHSRKGNSDILVEMYVRVLCTLRRHRHFRKYFFTFTGNRIRWLTTMVVLGVQSVAAKSC